MSERNRSSFQPRRQRRQGEWRARLAFVLVLPYLLLLQAQARPTVDVLQDLHISGSCACCCTSSAPALAGEAEGGGPTECRSPSTASSCRGPAAPQEDAPAGTDHDDSCCDSSGSKCACYRATPGGVAWLPVATSLPLPLAWSIIGHRGQDHVRDGGLAPPEQPPKT
ncbi:MAG: hypothetical protein Q8O14_03660 [bacterium]|jgi:hypothetical protein|nr:hypothetical protein [bacterium]